MASRKIADLHIQVQELAHLWLNACEYAELDVLITSTLRTYHEQNELYALGRTKPGRKVTNARGGWSWHNHGLAFDFVPLRHGKPVWSASDLLWRRAAIIGENIGFQWGGRWTRIKDLPHFEFHPGLDIRGALALNDQKGGIPEDQFDKWFAERLISKVDLDWLIVCHSPTK